MSGTAAVGPTAQFFAHLAEGRFMIQRVKSTGQYVFYPRAVAPLSGDTDLEWVEASGRGVIHSTTTLRNRPPTPDQTLSIVELEEGPRMLCRVVDVEPGETGIGDAVSAFIAQEDDKPILLFRREKGA